MSLPVMVIVTLPLGATEPSPVTVNLMISSSSTVMFWGVTSTTEASLETVKVLVSDEAL